MQSTVLSDADVYELCQTLPNLVELKFALGVSTTIDTLYYLKQLTLLKVLDFGRSWPKSLDVMLNSILYELPQLKIAGTKVDKNLFCVCSQSAVRHAVPFKKLALEHIVVVSHRFISHHQAQMLPNLTTLCVRGFCILRAFDRI